MQQQTNDQTSTNGKIPQVPSVPFEPPKKPPSDRSGGGDGDDSNGGHSNDEDENIVMSPNTLFVIAFLGVFALLVAQICGKAAVVLLLTTSWSAFLKFLSSLPTMPTMRGEQFGTSPTSGTQAGPETVTL
ncbi:hypothetical protein CDV31_015238 [Fusarium ambrosium]|uniref:Transmembrane protein n=1 Tax=Fusarium ambrosium TaxID=131363 RepID=A0A428SR89_9HYPO|nr:hypothetical protein CDV31_015238 [Fusarium ambrosium]